MKSLNVFATIPFLVILIVCVENVQADSIFDVIFSRIKNLDPFTIKNGTQSCPDIPFSNQIGGEKCGDSNSVYYYDCSPSDQNQGPIEVVKEKLIGKCNFHLQDWVWTVIVILIALLVLSIIINILRCLFCCHC